MSTLTRKHPTLLALALTLFAAVSILGITYCVLALAGVESCTLAECTLVLYGVYFVVCGVSIVGILRWKRWGVYALGSATFSVAVIALLQNAFRMRDLLVGALLVTAAVAVLRPAWHDLE
jgi:hypothetical protein